MRRRRLTLFALIALALGVAACGAGPAAAPDTAYSEAAPSDGVAVGQPAPGFELARLDGSRVSSESLRGAPSVIVFWTAWCPTCEEEAPVINELATQFEPRGVRVLGINIKDSPQRAKGGIEEFGIRYDVALDADASVAKRYGVRGTPTVVFLDARGVARYVGNELPKDYPERLGRLLAEG